MDKEFSVESQAEVSEEDIFHILIATDIHLGYAEDDPVRGQDTFDTFEEILKIGSDNEVDLILLGGDLFHHAQPSPYCIYKCMELLKKYCLGDRPVSIEFLSDPSQNFYHKSSTTVNYEDPNLNVSLPVFSIHGNHDDPTGKKHISAMDLLSTSGLVNYFGRWENLVKVEISPILLKKGNSKLALYGLSHIRDERLGRLFLEDKVKLLHPENKEDWFHLLVWHQNRATRGTKNFIPDNCLPDFLDMVIWGHEHDCRIEPEEKHNGVLISQPGSSVATSLIEGESITKKVGILKIYKNKYEMVPVVLKTVRPFKYDEISLKGEILIGDDCDSSSSEQVKKIVTKKIDSMIKEARELGHTEKVSDKPLIRLIVRYKNERDVFNTIRFGQAYINKVANPENMLKFQLLRDYRERKQNNQNINDNEEEEEQGPMLAERVEDLVSQHFTENNNLNFYPLNLLNESVKRYIDCSDANVIADMTEQLIKDTLITLEKDSPSIESTKNAIKVIKNKMDEDSINFVNKFLANSKGQKNKEASENIDDNELQNTVGKSSRKKTTVKDKDVSKVRGRGKGRGGSSSRINIKDDDDDDNDGNRGAGRGRGRGKTRVGSSSRVNIKVDVDEDVSIIDDGDKNARGKSSSRINTKDDDDDDDDISIIDDDDDDNNGIGYYVLGMNKPSRRN